MDKTQELAIQESLKALGISTEDLLDSIPTWTKDTSLPSRSKVREVWKQGKEVTSEDIEAFEKLFEVFTSADLSNREFPTEEEIDAVADELLSIRQVKDMLEGRESAIRSYVFDSVNHRLTFEGKDPERDSGVLTSYEYGVNLSKEVSGGKPQIDVDKLFEVLESDQFTLVTNQIETTVVTRYPNGDRTSDTVISYEVNEKELEKQLIAGNVGMEQILKATTPTKTKTAFYVRKIKANKEDA